ncbi:SAF domain-containing protein [Micromonospora sp. WMMD1082]|uniref:SAF domain-containing protein n=1 Tax=Micromonospora sp. WMMD1082 TaxID=3016104 RepID=UPI0024170BB8|nr:SAF domain-containing protein [Micromonospora sp. WMMD1082]MDG4795440.1 SAF domain-containing protein [Micromonospora sp. WMMD1082]
MPTATPMDARQRLDNATTTAALTTVIASRRRSPLRIIGGLLVIALGFVIGAVVLGSVSKAVDVLAVARPVAAGAVLTDADVTTVSIVPADTLRVIPAGHRAQVVGQTAAVPLAAGSLLVMDQVGAVTDPAPGQSVLAVGVKTGHAPAGLSAGATVVVLVVPASAGSGSAREVVQAPALVRAVEAPDAAGLTVVTVQLASEAALRVASAAGEVTIIVRGR